MLASGKETSSTLTTSLNCVEDGNALSELYRSGKYTSRLAWEEMWNAQ